MRVEIYDKTQKCVWNDFLKRAKNRHFFFNREFLDYHGDRFKDFSLLIYNSKGKLTALLPANIDRDILYTHQGLTYGGFIVSDSMKVEIMLDIFKELRAFLKHRGINRLIYKAVPHIHHIKSSQEDIYALFKEGAKLIRREVSSTIYLDKPIRYSNGRKWSLKRGESLGFEIESSRDFSLFWSLLESVLDKYHNSKPTHSLSEISHLSTLFPDNIKLFLIKRDSKLLAGAVTFDNCEISHLQYVANSDEGREVGALDFLIDHLIKRVYHNKRYFDFGTSSKDSGRALNMGLIDQKERFDARAVAVDRYELII